MHDRIEPMHRTIVFLDVEGYASRSDPDRLVVRDAMYSVLQDALRWSDVTEDRRELTDRGDGIMILVPANVPKSALLVNLPQALIRALAEHNANVASPHRVRLRLALHAGEVVRDRRGYVGASIDHTVALLNSPEFQAAAELADVDLATAVTESFYQQVVAHGPRGINPSAFHRFLVKTRGSSFFARFHVNDPPLDPPPPTASVGSGDLHHIVMFLVDIENYGSRPDKIKGVLRAELRRMVTAAMAEAKVSPLQPPTDDGDGLCFLFAPTTSKNRLIDPLVPALTRLLSNYKPTALPDAEIRLRAVVDCGELYRDDHNYYGSALDDAYGLLNSAELRKHLELQTNCVISLLVSSEIYDGVVRHAYGDIDSATYAPMTVRLKHRDVEAWVHGAEEMPQAGR